MQESTRSVREIIAEEYIKCAKDPVYFMKKYCYIQHPTKGRVLFDLFPFQEPVLRVFRDNQYSLVLKSRQLGISTLAAGYSLWLMTFHKDKNILALATTQATARNLVQKVIFMYENLPKWLKIPATEKNKLSLRLKNGSRAIAKASNEDAARSEAVSLLLIDEAAFISDVESVFTAAQQTLATGGQCIAMSTPNGIGNWFHQTWEKAELGDNKFIPIKLPWTVHPERDQSWRDDQDKQLGERMASQECDATFLSSGDTVFDNVDMEYFEQNTVREPLEIRGIDSHLWIWQPVEGDRQYMVVADVARGDASDYSTFHVMDVDSLEQVAEYRGKVSPKDFGNILVVLGTEYNDALVVVENAGVGWATIEQIMSREYKNLYYSSKSDTDTVQSYQFKMERDRLTPGFSMNLRTRPLVISKLLEHVKERSITIRSKRLMSEFRVFIWRNSKPQAQSGYNDDLLMAFAIGLYVRDTALKLHRAGTDLTRAQLSAISSVNSYHNSAISQVGLQDSNPYIIHTQHGTQDISWVLG